MMATCVTLGTSRRFELPTQQTKNFFVAFPCPLSNGKWRHRELGMMSLGDTMYIPGGDAMLGICGPDHVTPGGASPLRECECTPGEHCARGRGIGVNHRRT